MTGENAVQEAASEEPQTQTAATEDPVPSSELAAQPKKKGRPAGSKDKVKRNVKIKVVPLKEEEPVKETILQEPVQETATKRNEEAHEIEPPQLQRQESFYTSFNDLSPKTRRKQLAKCQRELVEQEKFDKRYKTQNHIESKCTMAWVY